MYDHSRIKLEINYRMISGKYMEIKNIYILEITHGSKRKSPRKSEIKK